MVTRTVEMGGGDVLTVEWTGSVWVSPCNGRQHGGARLAMRDEVFRYLLDCGFHHDAIEDLIDGHLNRMADGPEASHAATR
jgi:hypothetical protein